MKTLRLIMAVSGDGIVSRGPDDDMSWTGAEDKAIFRALTGVGGLCGIGSKTARTMPNRLDGRVLMPLSRSGFTLEHLALASAGSAWLLGGLTVARAALEEGLVAEVHMCVVPKILDCGGQLFDLQPWLGAVRMKTVFPGGTEVWLYRP